MRDGRRGGARGRAGVLSPNDVRREEGWPASNDPTADSIEPLLAGGKAIQSSGCMAFISKLPLSSDHD
jgi:hypothetical protein